MKTQLPMARSAMQMLQLETVSLLAELSDAKILQQAKQTAHTYTVCSLWRSLPKNSWQLVLPACL